MLVLPPPPPTAEGLGGPSQIGFEVVRSGSGHCRIPHFNFQSSEEFLSHPPTTKRKKTEKQLSARDLRTTKPRTRVASRSPTALLSPCLGEGSPTKIDRQKLVPLL